VATAARGSPAAQYSVPPRSAGGNGVPAVGNTTVETVFRLAASPAAGVMYETMTTPPSSERTQQRRKCAS
jgi:hypothetical protein